MKIATREIVREIDRKTIEKHGISGITLMENAGRATADVITEEFPFAEKVAVFAGGGNRAFYQLGLMNRWGERLLPRTADGNCAISSSGRSKSKSVTCMGRDYSFRLAAGCPIRR